uniref:Uncharacterized protein n=1 Tax=Anopheles funestus TaxID=62324 RepID=A0A4Y0BLK1_ANOFN
MKLSMKLFIVSQVVITGVIAVKKYPDTFRNIFSKTKTVPKESDTTVPAAER